MEERKRCKICHRNARNTAYPISYTAVCFKRLKKFPKNSKRFPMKFFLEIFKDKFLASVILCIHGASKSVQE